MPNVKTITLTGEETEVRFDKKYPYFWVQNLGDSDVLMSVSPNIVPDADGVICISAKGGGSTGDVGQCSTLYLSGSGKVQIFAQYNAVCPFKNAGKGGEKDDRGLKKVDELPKTGSSKYMYLVPKSSLFSDNFFDEYLWIDEEERWELVGDTKLDLTDYPKKDEVVSGIKGEAETEYRQGNVTITKEDMGINTATTITSTSDDTTFPTSKAVYDFCQSTKIQKQISKTLSAKGWYRFAVPGSVVVPYECVGFISHQWGDTKPESYTFIYNSAYDKQEFKLLNAVYNQQLITKVRVVKPKIPYSDGITHESLTYLDLYYNSDNENWCSVGLLATWIYSSSKISDFSLVSDEVPDGYEAIEYDLIADNMQSVSQLNLMTAEDKSKLDSITPEMIEKLKNL